jgi:hypothetical protein
VLLFTPIFLVFSSQNWVKVKHAAWWNFKGIKIVFLFYFLIIMSIVFPLLIRACSNSSCNYNENKVAHKVRVRVTFQTRQYLVFSSQNWVNWRRLKPRLTSTHDLPKNRSPKNRFLYTHDVFGYIPTSIKLACKSCLSWYCYSFSWIKP